jgi:hypothetical protein
MLFSNLPRTLSRSNIRACKSTAEPWSNLAFRHARLSIRGEFLYVHDFSCEHPLEAPGSGDHTVTGLNFAPRTRIARFGVLLEVLDF